MKFLKLFKSAPLSAQIGIFVIIVNIFVSLAAPVLTSYGEAEIVGDVWDSATIDSPFGTDNLGRDMLTRIVYGARNTNSLAVSITIIAFSIGTFGGFLAAVLGGWFGQLLSRTNDIIMGFPTLILAMLVLSVMGSTIPVLTGILSILTATRVYRLALAVARDITVHDYVEVARVRGEGNWWIMRKEILPNALAPLVAEFGLRFCFVFLFISSLSFLGIGIQPPSADWGAMVRENASAISFGILTPLLPACAIAILTVAINSVVDWYLNIFAGRLHDDF